jgi:hypothetical protein
MALIAKRGNVTLTPPRDASNRSQPTAGMSETETTFPNRHSAEVFSIHVREAHVHRKKVFAMIDVRQQWTH